MNRGTRLAIVAGIIIAVAGTATILAVTTATPKAPAPSADAGNSTNSEPRHITVELDENLTVVAK